MVVHATSDSTLLANDAETRVIEFRNACKKFGVGSKSAPIFNGLNLVVYHGTIYGLLGPSGCGKTTLLHCAVSKERLTSGTVLVFGRSPGSPGSGIPGSRVGYMPQDTVLPQHLTISETMTLYGKVHGLRTDSVTDRERELKQLLDLPVGSTMVSHLSGGQCKRVSFAISVLHQPELLVLDEPTVGVDPILRSCIWDYLKRLAKARQTTIIFTTHYIEEARQSDCIGLMRSGRLLTEDSPINLIAKHNLPNLESVFLHYVKLHDSQTLEQNGTDISHSATSKERIVNKKTGKGGWLRRSKIVPEETIDKQDIPSRMFSLLIMSVMAWSSFKYVWRNKAFLTFAILLPSFGTVLLAMSIGKDPTDLDVAIVNKDALECNDDASRCPVDFLFESTETMRLSCDFINHLDLGVFNLHDYSSLEDAIEAVKNGNMFGVIYFEESFSQAFVSNGLHSMKLNSTSSETGNIHIFLDHSNFQVVLMMKLALRESYLAFINGLGEACNMPDGIMSPPLEFEQPIFGDLKPHFSDFLIPSQMVCQMALLPMGVFTQILINDKKERHLERFWVSGVHPLEYFLGNAIVHIGLMSIQGITVLTSLVYVCRFEIVGSIYLAFLLIWSQGVLGIVTGNLISLLVNDANVAGFVVIGICFPLITLTGSFWPVEAMPGYLQMLAFSFSQTHVNEAVRGIISSGWGIQHLPVQMSFLISLAWFAGLFLIMFVFRKRAMK